MALLRLVPLALILTLLAAASAEAAAPGVNIVATKCPPRDAHGTIVDSNAWPSAAWPTTRTSPTACGSR